MMHSRDVYQKRLETIRARLSEIGADGLYATPSSNLYYLTGIGFDRSERLTALLLFRDRAPVVLCPAFEADRLRQMAAVKEVQTWAETEDPFRKAAALFPSSAGTLAVEPSTAFEDVERLIAARPGWKPVAASSLFRQLRMIKTPDEIEAMHRAIAIAVPRFQKAFAALRPGAAESDISAAFGGRHVVQFGPSSALPHGASAQWRFFWGQPLVSDLIGTVGVY